MAELTIQQAFELAVQHHQAGRLAEAEELYRQILALQPEHAGALHHLGVIAHQVGRNDVAADMIRRALALKPAYAEARYNLGNVLQANGQVDDAIAAYRQALALKPDYSEAHYSLGNALQSVGCQDEAMAAWRQAVALRPAYPEAHYNLGVALQARGEVDDAITAYLQAIAFNPGYCEAYNNLGNVLKASGRPDEAIAAFRHALLLRPNYPQAHANLGNALQSKGQLDEAIAAYRAALQLKPDFATADCNLVYSLHFHPRYDAQAIAQEHRRWNQQHARPLQSCMQPHANDRDPGRRLRIGYVSPDLRDHVVGRNMLPLLANHDKSRVEVFAFAEVLVPDARSRQLQDYTDHWQNTVGMSDEAVAEQVRRDRIDILVDLALHMANNRLLVFARKPAPVQVTFAGYPGSTGLSSIDYRLSDPYLDPPGMDESIYSEETIRLPYSFWCYDPLDGREAPVNPLPALHSGTVTFGCLNNFCKINENVLALWAQVLRKTANSRLLLLAPEGDHRQRTLQRLQGEGIDPGRVQFVSPQPRRDYLELYHRIDVGLDSFPYNGHTTSLDSFWMGVPVITLAGQTAVARAGWCQLSNLGLRELAGHTPKEFVQIAVELAHNLPRLKELRATLRQRMEGSPLMDGKKFARGIETAYRQMWRRWCTANC